MELGEKEEAPSLQEEEDLRTKAEERVKERIGLYWDIAAYLIINGFLVILWALTKGEGNAGYWFVWPLLGWGIGLLFHIFGVVTGEKSEAVRERMIQKEMEKMKK